MLSHVGFCWSCKKLNTVKHLQFHYSCCFPLARFWCVVNCWSLNLLSCDGRLVKLGSTNYEKVKYNLFLVVDNWLLF